MWAPFKAPYKRTASYAQKKEFSKEIEVDLRDVFSDLKVVRESKVWDVSKLN